MAKERYGAKSIAALLSICVALCLCCFGLIGLAYAGSLATDSNSVNRTRSIAVVYDNSGSMVNYPSAEESGTKWCTAKYGLEALAAMMNPGDKLTVFLMDDQGSFQISGSDSPQARATAIHNTDMNLSDWTTADTVDQAYESLRADVGAYDERVLVVITDGEFDKGGSIDDVTATARSAASEGISVIYFAIGDDASLIEEDADLGIVVKHASKENILDTMNGVANQIFGRSALSSKDYDDSSSSLKIDIPIQQLIVFAQGENVSVGTLTGNDTNEKASIVNVKFSESPSASQIERCVGFNVDPSLEGVVAVFDAQLPSGEYKLDISGAESFEIYYKPYADVETTLKSETGSKYIVSSLDHTSVPAGKYTPTFRLLDPFSGEELTSSLIDSVSYTATMQYSDGKSVVLKEGEQGELAEGSGTFSTSALINDDAVTGQTYSNFTVAPSDLGVVVEYVPSSFSVKALDESEAIVVIVTKKDVPLTDSEWKNTTLQVSSSAIYEPIGLMKFIGTQKSIAAKVEKGDDVSTYTIKLAQFEGDAAKTLSGEVPLTITAVYDSPNGKSYGETVCTISIEGLSLLERILSWIRLHPLQFVLLLLLLLLLFCIIKHSRIPRLPKGMKPSLLEASHGKKASLSVTAGKKKTPLLFGAETQAMTLSVKKPYSMTVFPTNITLRAVKGKNGKRMMKIDNWSSVLGCAKTGGEDAVRINSRKIDHKEGSESPLLTSSAKINMAARLNNRMTELELRFKS